VVAVVVAEVTTTDAREAAALAMVDVTAMENGTNNVGHIREMIVVTAVARTAADRAAIAGAVVTTATSRSRRTTAGRSLPGTLMGTTVEVVETWRPQWWRRRRRRTWSGGLDETDCAERESRS
jgi:C4-dicarboxylate transporter